MRGVPQQIYGVGPKNSAVEIVDSDGETVATTKTTNTGGWCVPSVILAAGQHELRAICTNACGREFSSQPLTLDVEADESEFDVEIDAEESDEDDGLDYAREIYERHVRARADGFVVDPDDFADLLTFVGKTRGDFFDDALDLILQQRMEPDDV